MEGCPKCQACHGPAPKHVLKVTNVKSIRKKLNLVKMCIFKALGPNELGVLQTGGLMLEVR